MLCWENEYSNTCCYIILYEVRVVQKAFKINITEHSTEYSKSTNASLVGDDSLDFHSSTLISNLRGGVGGSRQVKGAEERVACSILLQILPWM